LTQDWRYGFNSKTSPPWSGPPSSVVPKRLPAESITTAVGCSPSGQFASAQKACSVLRDEPENRNTVPPPNFWHPVSSYPRPTFAVPYRFPDESAIKLVGPKPSLQSSREQKLYNTVSVPSGASL